MDCAFNIIVLLVELQELLGTHPLAQKLKILNQDGTDGLYFF